MSPSTIIFFPPDGDRIGRYSIFQYQRVENSGYKYVWVGEFGEYVDLVFNETNLVGSSMSQVSYNLKSLVLNLFVKLVDQP